MSDKVLVQIASRALSLNLVVWSAATLVYLLPEAFSFFHYSNLTDRTSLQDYYYKYDIILIASRLILSAGLFIASVWIYKCGPDVHRRVISLTPRLGLSILISFVNDAEMIEGTCITN
jgi:hypothetical protein